MAARNAKESADDEANEGGGRRWKFNKNTQAWLLRNMFSEDEVSFTPLKARSELAREKGWLYIYSACHASMLASRWCWGMMFTTSYQSVPWPFTEGNSQRER